jgi:hypothetical protein
MIICSIFNDAALLYDMLADVSMPLSRGVGTMAAAVHSFPILDAMVHVNSQSLHMYCTENYFHVAKLSADNFFVRYGSGVPVSSTNRVVLLCGMRFAYRII